MSADAHGPLTTRTVLTTQARRQTPASASDDGAVITCRAEYVRLLEQALGALGFHDAARQLQKDSGIALEPPTVGQLRAAVIAGSFDKAVAVVSQLPLASPAQTQQAKFLLLEQKYLEVGFLSFLFF